MKVRTKDEATKYMSLHSPRRAINILIKERDEARQLAEKYQSLVYSIACFQNTVRVKEERLPWTKEDIEADEVAWQKAVDESAVIK